MNSGGSGLRPEAITFVPASDSVLGGDVTGTATANITVAEGQNGPGQDPVSFSPLTHLSLLRTDG